MRIGTPQRSALCAACRPDDSSVATAVFQAAYERDEARESRYLPVSGSRGRRSSPEDILT